MINNENSRIKSRRGDTRRRQERRTIPYLFGSDEWLREIKSVYLLWPKEERRVISRRSRERRAAERRHNKTKQTLFPPQKKETNARLLTEEEKHMLDDILTG